FLERVAQERRVLIAQFGRDVDLAVVIDRVPHESLLCWTAGVGHRTRLHLTPRSIRLPESSRHTTPEYVFSLFRPKLATRHRDHHGVQLGADFRHTCLE